LTASVAAAALTATGLTATAHADSGGAKPVLLPPKGAHLTGTTQPATTSGSTAKPQIIGGTDTAFSAAPWMVQLLFEWDNDGNFYFTCGGTLVAPNKVLTAAHCVEDENGAALDWVNHGLVLGGTAKLVGGGGSDPEGTVATVKRVWHYSSFSPATLDNDVALLTLDQPLPYKTLPTAKSTDASLYTAGTQATVYGWGVTDSAAGSPNLAPTLRHLAEPVNSDATCSSALDAAVGPGVFKPGHMMCAGVPATGDDTTNKTTCSGDSGGPLVAGGKVIGVVSWGVADDSHDCGVAGTYDVFTHLSTYGAAVQPHVDDTDHSRDGRADLAVRTTAGGSYVHISNGTAFPTRVTSPVSFKADNLVVPADLDRDGYQDYLVRNSSTGAIYSVRRSATSATYKGTYLYGGWGSVKAIVVPGDLTSDGIPDMVAESPDGRVSVYPGKGNGTFGAPTQFASGWWQYNQVLGHGDFSNDGIADVITRDAATGDLYLNTGTGKASAPLAPRVLLQKNWGGWNKLVAAGDITGDGRADLAARTPSGTLYIFPGNGQVASGGFGHSLLVCTGWQQYDMID
jgi:secreted trypsin-like serine protease